MVSAVLYLQIWQTVKSRPHEQPTPGRPGHRKCRAATRIGEAIAHQRGERIGVMIGKDNIDA